MFRNDEIAVDARVTLKTFAVDNLLVGIIMCSRCVNCMTRLDSGLQRRLVAALKGVSQRVKLSMLYSLPLRHNKHLTLAMWRPHRM